MQKWVEKTTDNRESQIQKIHVFKDVSIHRFYVMAFNAAVVFSLDL